MDICNARTVVLVSKGDLPQVVVRSRELIETSRDLSRLAWENIFRVDGDSLRLVAHHASIPAGPVGLFTLPMIRGTVAGRRSRTRFPSPCGHGGRHLGAERCAAIVACS